MSDCYGQLCLGLLVLGSLVVEVKKPEQKLRKAEGVSQVKIKVGIEDLRARTYYQTVWFSSPVSHGI